MPIDGQNPVGDMVSDGYCCHYVVVVLLFLFMLLMSVVCLFVVLYYDNFFLLVFVVGFHVSDVFFFCHICCFLSPMFFLVETDHFSFILFISILSQLFMSRCSTKIVIPHGFHNLTKSRYETINFIEFL